MVIKDTLRPGQEHFPYWLINQASFTDTTEESSDTSDDKPEDEATPDDPIPPPVVIPDKSDSGKK